jgi:hypothetical protein
MIAGLNGGLASQTLGQVLAGAQEQGVQLHQFQQASLAAWAAAWVSTAQNSAIVAEHNCRLPKARSRSPKLLPESVSSTIRRLEGRWRWQGSFSDAVRMPS